MSRLVLVPSFQSCGKPGFGRPRAVHHIGDAGSFGPADISSFGHPFLTSGVKHGVRSFCREQDSSSESQESTAAHHLPPVVCALARKKHKLKTRKILGATMKVFLKATPPESLSSVLLTLFLADCSPTKIDYRTSWYPYSNLSTGRPSRHAGF